MDTDSKPTPYCNIASGRIGAEVGRLIWRIIFLPTPERLCLFLSPVIFSPFLFQPAQTN